MQRRAFLQGTAALAALHAFPGLARDVQSPPWALGFQGVSSDLPPLPMAVRGKIPEACTGTLYRNGPALYERAGQRYRHWFDPDGMIQAFRFGREGAVHAGRFVRTRKFRQEAAAGRFLFDGAGTRISGSLPPRNNDDFNTANINVQAFDGELLALWEAGSAYRVDPESLETLGTRSWREDLAGVPFSAHPRFDGRGDLWNIGSVSFGAEPLLVLYHIDAAGRLRKARTHRLDFAGYMHDFVLTGRYLVALNSSAVLGKGETFIDSMRWEPSRASQLLVFDKDSFDLLHTVEVPAAFVFHFGNGWDTRSGLEFTACQYPDARLATIGMARLARQQPGPYHDEPRLLRYRVDLHRGQAAVTDLGIDLEFPGFDRRRPFEPQALFGVSKGRNSPSGPASAVVRVNPSSGEVDRFDYGDGTLVEEPLPVPGPGAAASYLVHSYLDVERRRSGVSILRADALADGPVATAEMDRVVPLGFHGCFLTA
ncbi:carotenoid oxygenase family protein [Pseudohaliea sp.]|uniref:carotenoid oxygenase family protein n=1 Tax=Pseudohaliea sp. TaxID=2740289 RepID=UPI0032EFB14D